MPCPWMDCFVARSGVIKESGRPVASTASCGMPVPTLTLITINPSWRLYVVELGRAAADETVPGEVLSLCARVTAERAMRATGSKARLVLREDMVRTVKNGKRKSITLYHNVLDAFTARCMSV